MIAALDPSTPNLRHSFYRVLEALATSESSASALPFAKDAELVAFQQQHLVILTILLVVSYGSMSVLSAALVAYMRYNRHVAHKGDSEASRKTLLPAFEPLLWTLCVATGLHALFFTIALAKRFYVPGGDVMIVEAMSAARQFVVELVVVFMLQKSVSLPALMRSIVSTLILSCYALPFAWLITIYGQSTYTLKNQWMMAAVRLLFYSVYMYIIVRPPARATRRTLREYCAFGIVYQLLELAYRFIFIYGYIRPAFALTYIQLAWGSLCPIFFYRLLKADTEHWRGLGQRAVGLQAVFRKGNIHERVSSQGLHVLIEMHRKYIIDFSFLDIKQRIGIGSTAVVYNGLLNSKTPVAIKVYTPTSVTEDTVAAFSHEAALCGVLNHPNIVKFYASVLHPVTVSSSLSPDAEHYHEYPNSMTNASTNFHSNGVILTDTADKNIGLKPNLGKSAPEMTVKGTVDYMAPELINGRAGVAAYEESADVYSLAITMWDILKPGSEKYPGTNDNHLRVLELVMSGTRPELDRQLHVGLAEIITSMWHGDATVRPTAQKVVAALECIQEEVCSAFALEMWDGLHHESTLLRNAGSGRSVKSFSGELATQKMQDIEAVGSVGEGIRLGNMLMNTGLLHHQKHSLPFKSSDDVYFFDEDNVSHCQPFIVLEGHSCKSGAGCTTARRRPGSTMGGPLPSQLVQTSGWFKSLQRSHQPTDQTPSFLTTSTWVMNSKGSSYDTIAASESPQENSAFAFVDAASNETKETEECACRKLGERPNVRKAARHRFLRKYRAIPEDNVLTANLLQTEELTSPQDQQFLDEFDTLTK
ncbi:hypothetical protein CCR75_003775 [Bremia lactucae]|uniref:Protein kinase domain-containing protein n=1 Tax=Bremia lactucae TaxID=4779 RepID=A0A976NZ87_BRELC|nr:hypothetical protein CCR75_003775 [Bremia lactucae]